MSRSETWVVGVAVVVAVAGCDLPVEPGSDRPDAAPSAQLGPEIDTGRDITAEEGADITGEFALTAEVSSDFGDQTVAVPMRADVQQEGAISSGEATVAMTLRPEGGAQGSGASTEEPAAVEPSGAFQATVPGFTVPAGSSEMLEEDTTAEVVLEAQIVGSDCFEGDTTITMQDVVVSGSTIPEVVLEGPFTAHRVGSSCPEPSGGDAGTGMDASVESDSKD